MKGFLLVSALITFCVSCGKNDSSDTSSVADANYIGTWKSDCIPFSSGWYAVVTLTNTDSQSVADTAQYYNDTKCIAARITDKSTRTYTMGGLVSGLTKTYEIDYIYQKVERTYKAQANTDAANQDVGFGFSDWKVDIAKEITGLRYSDKFSYEPKKDEASYLIFKIEGNTYTGSDASTGDGTTKEKRPKTVSTTLSLTKQ